MSKSITIQEGGYGKNMTVDKLRTNLSEGGTCLWVPEDAVGLTTKHISENGTYPATEDGVYGYSVVYVNVPGGADGPPGGPGSSIVGTDPETGNEEIIEVDDNGDIVTKELPSFIVLQTNPSKMTYQDGETIDLTGAVIVAQKADGTTWTSEDYPSGVIPVSECTCDPDKASASGGTSKKYSGDGVTAILIEANGDKVNPAYTDRHRCEIISNVVLAHYGDTIYLTRFGSNVYATGYSGEIGRTSPISGPDTYGAWWNFSSPNIFSGFSPVVDIYNSDLIPYSDIDPTGVDINALQPVGATQTIVIKWPRPGDGRELITTFKVNVETNTGGNTGGGTTVDDDGFSGNEGNF